MPWTAAGAGEAVATAEGREAGTLGSVAEATIGEAPTLGELGPSMTAAPGVEVLAGGVGPWRTCGQKK